MLKKLLPLSVLLLVGPACLAADNCDALRAQIEANIAAKGVQGFSVTTVNALAQVPGQVVGVCGQGARKIVYARGGAGGGSSTGAGSSVNTTSAPPAARRAAAVARPTREEDILTECRDGTQSMGGTCKD